MRPDGRRADELRPVRLECGYTDYAEGSVLIHLGKTRVLCNASVSNDLPRWLIGQGRGWVTAEYALLPRATHTRTPRETRGFGGRTQEIRRLIGRALRMAVNLEAMPDLLITIDCDVIQADGGTRTAAITGGYVALQMALKRLMGEGHVGKDVLNHAISAVSVGIIEGEPRVDLCYAEDAVAEVDLNVVMAHNGALIDIQGSAEQHPFSRATLGHLLDLAAQGIAQLRTAQEEALGD